MRPPLVCYETQDEYLEHFKGKYCSYPIKTFDEIEVKFYEDMFEHAFYESSNKRGNKDTFSLKRAQRIDWIEDVLTDDNAELYIGYDSRTKSYDNSRRVAIITEDDYVVIIRLIRDKQAKFVTAYLADSGRTATEIRKSPEWAKK